MTSSYTLSRLALLLAATTLAQAAPPTVGSKAKDFSLTSTRGKTVRLSELLQGSPVALVVLRGYPGYQCPFCTRQVQDFVEHAKDFADAGLRVVMIYPGPAAEVGQRANEFLANKDFPESFEMLLDPDYKFTNLYELRWDAPHETAHPSTFLINKDDEITFSKISGSHGDRTSATGLLEAFKK
jgi:peroxiredoxin